MTQKHRLQTISTARWTEVVTTLGLEASKQYSGAQLLSLVNLFEGAVDDVFQTLMVNGYGREDEYEADALAIQGLQASGYDFAELLSIIESLQSAQSNTSGGFLSTHPDIADRIEKVKVNLKEAERSTPPPARTLRFQEIAGSW